MSIIAVAGIPKRASTKNFVKSLVSTIKGHFEILNTIQDQNEKTAFLQISGKLDPHAVVKRLNCKKFRSTHFHAYLPDEIPDFPHAYKEKKKRGDTGLQRNCVKQLLKAHEEIMREMQAKFTGLYDLSAGTGNELLNAIGKTVYKRLSAIKTPNNSMDTCANLTQMYRKRHPHFADFQFILSTLHVIQDTDGKSRDQLQESDLAFVPSPSYVIENMPYDEVQAVYKKYLAKIITVIVNHINDLDTTPANSSPEESTRSKIRQQLKNLVPHVPVMVESVTNKYFMPMEPNLYGVLVYGEPSLPPLGPFMKRFDVQSHGRCKHMYNLMILKVPKEKYTAILAADSTLIGDSKLVIRSSKYSFYKVPHEILTNASISNKIEEEPMEEYTDEQEPMEEYIDEEEPIDEYIEEEEWYDEQ